MELKWGWEWWVHGAAAAQLWLEMGCSRAWREEYLCVQEGTPSAGQRQTPGSPTCLGEIAELQGANVVLGGAEVLKGKTRCAIAIVAEAKIQHLRRLGRVGLCHSGRRTGILHLGVDASFSPS